MHYGICANCLFHFIFLTNYTFLTMFFAFVIFIVSLQEYLVIASPFLSLFLFFFLFSFFFSFSFIFLFLFPYLHHFLNLEWHFVRVPLCSCTFCCPVQLLNLTKVRGPPFSLEWGGGSWISESTSAISLWPPLFDDQKFHDPPSELQCWRNM